jgi:hypothetical protein
MSDVYTAKSKGDSPPPCGNPCLISLDDYLCNVFCLLMAARDLYILCVMTMQCSPHLICCFGAYHNYRGDLAARTVACGRGKGGVKAAAGWFVRRLITGRTKSAKMLRSSMNNVTQLLNFRCQPSGCQWEG